MSSIWGILLLPILLVGFLILVEEDKLPFYFSFPSWLIPTLIFFNIVLGIGVGIMNPSQQYAEDCIEYGAGITKTC